jgi:alpha-D-ribose 1-methylphosphonate 5-triphosphate synthase subunit PhnH
MPQTNHPEQTVFEAITHATFEALMWAFAHPGEAQDVPHGDPCLRVAEALLDLETSFFTPDERLRNLVRVMGARERSADRAEFHFYPRLEASHLEFVRQAQRGDALYPHRAATLVIGCAFDSYPSQRLRLTGPGIETARELEVGRVPSGFWQAREDARRYPLGHDVLLVSSESGPNGLASGGTVLGIPRSTHLELLQQAH